MFRPRRRTWRPMRDLGDARRRGPHPHLNDTHGVSFGELTVPLPTRRSNRRNDGGVRFDSRSARHLQEMWKNGCSSPPWPASLPDAGARRGHCRADAADLATALLDECSAIAAANALRPRSNDGRSRHADDAGLHFAASMLRDIEHGARSRPITCRRFATPRRRRRSAIPCCGSPMRI